MSFNVSIYVEGERLDLFKDENISLVDSLQNVRDPANAFASFTRQFTVPASKRNNKIFKHYYKPEVLIIPDEGLGFDARKYYDADIRINLATFKTGQIKLNSVNIINGKASEYVITFYDYVVKLNTTIAATKLANLSYLTRFDHDYTYENVKDGLESGLYYDPVSGVVDRRTTGEVPNILYPFISHTKQYVYDSTSTPTMYDLDLFNEDGTKESLDYNQLKPAIRFLDILTAIEQQFDIRFYDNSFMSSKALEGMYLWLHKDKGGIAGYGTGTCFLPMEDFTYQSGSVGDFRYDEKFIYQPQGYTEEYRDTSFIGLDLEVSPTGSGEYSVYIINGRTNTILFEQQKNNTSEGVPKTFSVEIPKEEGEDIIYPQIKIEAEDTISAVSVELTITRDFGNTAPVVETNVYTSNSGAEASFVSVLSNIPDIGVLDFLKGMFKMFNLTIRLKSLGVDSGSSGTTSTTLNWSTQTILGYGGGFSLNAGVADIDASLVTVINFDRDSLSGSSWLAAMNVGDILYFTQGTVPSNYAEFEVTGITTSSGGYMYNISVSYITSTGTIFEPYQIHSVYYESATLNSQFDTYEIDTLDSFYSSGSEIDITKYVNTSESSVFPTAPYNRISFKFEEAKTFLMDRRYAQLGERYGDDSYDLTGIFNGKNYDIKIPFEKILFERMEDLNSGAATNISNNLWSWCVDSSENPVATKPIVFFCDPDTLITGADVDWNASPSVTSTSYLLCSNTITNVDDIALGFKNEIGEYSLVTQDSSLFGKYWEDYIVGVYNAESRLLKLKARFPSSFILEYKLNDTIIYKGREYFINELDINLNTGEAEIELITKWL